MLLDPDTGKPRFTRQEAQYTLGAPAGSETAVAYVTAGGQQLVVLDALTGRQWMRIDSGENGGIRRARPIVMDEKDLFVEIGGRFTCLDLDRGTPRWSLPVRGSDPDCPMAWLLARDRRMILLGTQDACCVALDVATGATLWEQRYGPARNEGMNVFPICGAIRGDRGLILVAESKPRTAISGLAVLKPQLHCHDLATGKPLWKADASGAPDAAVSVSQPLLTREHVLLASRQRRYEGSSHWLDDEIRLLDLASGRLAGRRDSSFSFDAGQKTLPNYSTSLPVTARGRTLILGEAKAPAACRGAPVTPPNPPPAGGASP
jgi:outer membrane protein assembly factor BamB